MLLITAETYSKFLNPQDRGTRTIFGDGAAATLVRGDDSVAEFHRALDRSIRVRYGRSRGSQPDCASGWFAGLVRLSPPRLLLTRAGASHRRLSLHERP